MSTARAPPRKRARTCTSTNASAAPAFLSGHTIALALPPIRAAQKTILAASLRDAGATLLDTAELLRECDGCDMVFVVTDSRARAARLWEPIAKRCAARAVFVKLAWAFDMLTRRHPLSVAQYEWPPEAASPTRDERLAKEALHTSRACVGEGMFLPIWCTKFYHPVSDAPTRAGLLAKMPKYACQRATITKHLYPAPNEESGLVEQLLLIGRKRELEAAGGSAVAADIHARAYRKAAAALRCVPWPLRAVQDAQAVPYVSDRIRAVVNEFLTTGKATEAMAFKNDTRLSAIAELTGLFGVGAAKARELHDKHGFRSAAAVIEKAAQSPFSANGLGLPGSFFKCVPYYSALQTPVSSADARAFVQTIDQVANGVGGLGLQLRLVLCGGFRRGERTGHDMDIVYCRRDCMAHDHSSVLQELTDELERRGVLVERLREVSDTDGWGEVRYSGKQRKGFFRYAHDILNGICQVGTKMFRVDFVGVRDASEFPFATLAWSGSTMFQRDLRAYCDDVHGWVFSQHGLFDKYTGQRIVLRPAPKTEQDVFETLRLPYRAPFERSS